MNDDPIMVVGSGPMSDSVKEAIKKGCHRVVLVDDFPRLSKSLASMLHGEGMYLEPPELPVEREPKGKHTKKKKWESPYGP